MPFLTLRSISQACLSSTLCWPHISPPAHEAADYSRTCCEAVLLTSRGLRSAVLLQALLAEIPWLPSPSILQSPLEA
jgi:hypothetical protein